MPNEVKTFVHGGNFNRSPKDQLEKLLGFGSCVVSDAMLGLQSMAARIKPIYPGIRFCGNAFTVKVHPGDNLAFHEAIEQAQAGDIIVVDTGRNETNAVLGDMMAFGLFAKQIAGLVVDGVIRDLEVLQNNHYPIFAVGHVPTAPTFLAQGRLNQAVACGDLAVLPGDIILADTDGIVVVPPAYIEEILDRCEKKIAAETIKRKNIEDGKRVAPLLQERLRGYGLRPETEEKTE